MPGPVLYSSDKTMPWNYGGDVYYHGIKQDWPAAEDSISEKVNPDINNIAGTSKITRSGWIFSPEIAPPKAISGPVIIPVAAPKVTPTPIIISANTPIDKAVTTPVIIPTDTPAAEFTETRGKGVQFEFVRTKTQSLTIPETSKKEMEEILKIIKKRDYDVVEQLGQTPSKISMLELLLCSRGACKSLGEVPKNSPCTSRDIC